MLILTLVYVFLFSFLISTLYVDKMKKRHVTFKALTSLAFVVAGVYFAYQANAFLSPYFAFTIAALSLCLIGDILLAVTPGKAGSLYFFLGVGLFLLAHLVFCVGFSQLAPFTFVDFIFPVLFVALVFGLSRMESIQMGDMLPVICIYAFFVALLASKAITLFFTLGAALSTWLIMSGAVLFCISDLILIFVYFSTKDTPILKFVNLLAYYLATFLLACTVGYI